jgi:hypothetical protein
MWTGYNTMVVCFPIKLSSSPIIRAIRWMELRQDQSTGLWSIYQESTYAPDNYCRWMGAIAMDDEGNIALSYCKSGPTSLTPYVYPSLGYTGRLAGDTLGRMTFGENIVVAGTSTISGTRFGDYSQTTLDPTDGLTFWHTGEYVAGGKKTYIYSFKLSSTQVGIPSVNNGVQIAASTIDNSIFVKASGLTTGTEKHNLDLFDINGRKLSSTEVIPVNGEFTYVFDAAGLASGTYMVRLGKMQTSFQKVIKVNYVK